MPMWIGNLPGFKSESWGAQNSRGNYKITRLQYQYRLPMIELIRNTGSGVFTYGKNVPIGIF